MSNDDSRASWSSESERALLEIRAEKSVQEQVDATCRDSTVYGLVVDGLKERGIIRNKRQVINKLKYLRKKYMDLLLHNKTSGRSRKTIPNEDLLYLIWGARPSATPLRLVSSSASMVKRRVSVSPASSSLSSSSTSTSTIMSVSDSDDESDLEVEPEPEGDEVGEAAAEAEGQDSDAPDPHPVARPAPNDETVDDANSDNVEELAPAPARDPKKEDTAKAPYKLNAIKKKHNKSKLEKSCESMASLLKNSTSESHALFQASEDRRAEEQRKWERVLASENRESQQKIVDSFNNVQLQTMTIFQQMLGMLKSHHNAGPSAAAPWPNAAPGPNTAPWQNAAPGQSHTATGHNTAPGTSRTTWQNTAPTPNTAPWQNAAPGPSHTATGHNAAPGTSRTASGPNAAPGPSRTAWQNTAPTPNTAPWQNAAPGPSHTATKHNAAPGQSRTTSGPNAAPGPSLTASGPNAAPGPSYTTPEPITAPTPNISQELRHPSMRSVFPSRPAENPNLFSCSPGMESHQEYHRDVPARQQNTGLEEENHYTEL